MSSPHGIGQPLDYGYGLSKHECVGHGNKCRVCERDRRHYVHSLMGHDKWDALVDVFDEVVALYECSGCHRWFHPGDTFVTGDGFEYCYDDQTGNGCIVRHLSADKLAEIGVREQL